MPDCNHSTASCSCVALLGWGGGDQGGASCARGQQLLGGDMLMVGFCYIQTLPPTSVPHTLTTSTHTAAVLGHCWRHWTKNRSGPLLFHVPPPPRPHPLATQCKPTQRPESQCHIELFRFSASSCLAPALIFVPL